MKRKTIIIFSIVFILLIIGVLLPSIQQKITPPSPSLFDFSQYTKDSTTTIQIKKMDSEVSLVKEGSSWKTAQHTVSQQKIDDFFNSLKTVTEGSIVSFNVDNFPQYGIATSSSTLVQLKNAHSHIHVEVGNPGPGGNSFYARAIEGKYVYLFNGDIVTYLSAQEDDWREKRIVNVSSSDITNINVQGLKNFSLQKTENNWEYKAGEEKKIVPTDDIQQSISSLANLSASDFYTNEEKEALEALQTSTIITVETAAGTQLRLTVLKDDGYYLIQKNNESEIYKVPGYSLTNLLQLPDQK